LGEGKELQDLINKKKEKLMREKQELDKLKA
jgi:hypothetical protein